MCKYQRKEIAQLAHQLTLSPARLRDEQLSGAEALASIVEADKTYPYDFICYRITGYRKARESTAASVPGRALLADLARLVDDLSGMSPADARGARERLYTPTALAKRLSVSSKTISRWRSRGLIGRRYQLDDEKVGLAFTESAVERFVEANGELVRRAAAFKQLTEEERASMVKMARDLLARRRQKLHEVAQEISERTGRAVETIRYTLRRHDQENPGEAVFTKDETPKVNPEHRRLYEAWLAGDTVRDLAKALGRSQASVQNIIQEMRCRRIVEAPLSFIYSPEFDDPGADAALLSEDLCETVRFKKGRSTTKERTQPYLTDLATLPVLTAEQELGLFWPYNYVKCKAAQLREKLDPMAPNGRLLARIEDLLDLGEKTKAVLTKCNLRLVVSIAKKHVGNSTDLFEVVSDGNLSLMRAIEKFDYTRGNKFSTYATWAIIRSYARTIPEERYKARRNQAAADEMLDTVPDTSAAAESDWERKTLKDKMVAALATLDPREQAVVSNHFGLATGGHGKTLEEIGKTMGVTKERIRQIEKRALTKLRSIIPESYLDLVPE